jgi:methionyl-tRNA formyltransferase
MHDTKHTNLKILIFGSINCEMTQKAIRFLKSQNCEVTEYLTEYNPAANKHSLLSQNIKDWHGDYIICFKSLFLVPQWLLDRAKITSINFHPAPVEHPGRGCINFAIYERADSYGVTAHIVDAGIDSGPILQCRRFPIFKSDDFTSIFERAQAKMMDQFYDIITGVLNGGQKYIDHLISSAKHEKWNGKHRKISQLNEMLTVDHNTSKNELDKIIHASDLANKPPVTYINSYEFIYNTQNKDNLIMFEKAKKGF